MAAKSKKITETIAQHLETEETQETVKEEVKETIPEVTNEITPENTQEVVEEIKPKTPKTSDNSFYDFGLNSIF